MKDVPLHASFATKTKRTQFSLSAVIGIYLFLISQKTWSQLASSSLHGCYQSQEIPPLWPWVWLMSCYYLFNMKWMELCHVSPSVLTVWNIQRWLMGVWLSSDGPDHRLYWRYDIIRLLGVMSSHLQGQEEPLYPASLGEYWGELESAWLCDYSLCCWEYKFGIGHKD